MELLKCSICENSNIHLIRFGVKTNWREIEQNGQIILTNTIDLSYCSDCFYEYGGTLDDELD